MYKFLCGPKSSSLLGRYLGPYYNCMFSTRRNSATVFQRGCTASHPSWSAFSQRLSSGVVDLAILVHVRWDHTVVLICFSLLTDDVGHRFLYLPAMCLSSLEKGLFRSFAHFSIVFFAFLLLGCKHSFHVLDPTLLSDV